MKTLYQKLEKYILEYDPDKRSDWDKMLPHFGGGMLHRYQGFVSEYIKSKSKEKVCVYCLKPERYAGK